jgi:two-component system nitrate/nitrite response regulator NarL
MAHLTAVSSQHKPRVLTADSTPMNTQLLVEALGREEQFHLIESPSDPRVILQLIRREKPHIAVISADLQDPKRGGVDLIRKVRLECPEARVIVLLDSSERNGVTAAFRAGAQGVFCRTEPFRLLAKCIHCVANGQVWASSTELQYLLQALSQPVFPSNLNLQGGVLSARDIDVVLCVAEGLTNRQIAERLKLTEHTVKNYLFRIFEKLGVSSRVEVVLYAIRNGHAPHTAMMPNVRRLTPSSPRLALNDGPRTVPFRRTAT